MLDRFHVRSLLAVKNAPELYIIVILFAIATGSAVTDNLSYTPDSARYAIWANSIAAGNGFSDWTAPEPARYVVHAPLYSVLMFPAAAIAGEIIISLKYGTILLGMLLLTVLYLLVRVKSGRVAAGISVVILAFNPLTIHYSTQILSEILFAGLLSGFFLSMEYWRQKGFSGMAGMITVISLLIGCILSREVGIVLLIVVTAYLLFHERFEHAGWIFVAVILVFGAWHIRNEIVIAGQEHPDLRNVLLFSSNILTSGDQSVLDELWIRSIVNVKFYIGELHGLLFYPQFSLSGELQSTMYPVVDRASIWIKAAQGIVAPAFILVFLASAFMILAGIVEEYKRGSMAFVYLGFSALYSLMILIYPVVDIRFLYPLMIVQLILFGQGYGSLVRRVKGNRTMIGVIAVTVSLLPNILWTADFIHEARDYASDPEGYYDRGVTNGDRMTEYTKPFSAAAAWIRQQNDESPVIMSRWKELGLALPEKKILRLDAFTSLTLFEQSIRDYEIRYIVTTKDAAGWHDFEFQMNQSSGYSFRLVHSISGIDIYQAEKVTGGSSSEVQTRPMFRYLFHHLRQGNYDTLDMFFVKNKELAASHTYLRFFYGVTLEGLGRYDSAMSVFGTLHGLPQSIAIAQQINFHTNVIEQRKKAERMSLASERAPAFFNIAVNYWELDLRTLALQFLNATVQEDLSYLPAYNLFVYFSLENRDTVNAVAAYAAMKERFPAEPVVASFTSLFVHLNELRTAAGNNRRSVLLQHIADDYDRLGLSNNTIESLRQAFRLDPGNGDLALRLSSAYERKGKYFPALRAVSAAAEQQPSSESLKLRMQELQSRY